MHEPLESRALGNELGQVLGRLGAQGVVGQPQLTQVRQAAGLNQICNGSGPAARIGCKKIE